MKKSFILYLLSLTLFYIAPFSSVAQTNSSLSMKQDTIHRDSGFLANKYEQEVFLYLNELRTNPSDFYHRYVKSYVEKNPKRFTARYTSSLKKQLLNMQPLPPLRKNSDLSAIAGKQLKYLAYQLNGKRLTHERGDLSFAQRMRKSGMHCFAENLYRFPSAPPLRVVLDLLIDQGVSNMGHRKNILHKKYNLIGIKSIKAPNKYIVTVMDFGCK